MLIYAQRAMFVCVGCILSCLICAALLLLIFIICLRRHIAVVLVHLFEHLYQSGHCEAGGAWGKREEQNHHLIGGTATTLPLLIKWFVRA